MRLGCVYNILILKKWNFNFLFGYFGFLSNWERVWVRDDLGCCLFRLLLFVTITQQFDFIFSGLTRGTCCPAPLFYFQILSLRIFFFFFIFWFLNLKRIRKEWSATAVWCGSNRLALLYMAWLCVTVPTTRPWLPLPACLPAFISINNHLLFREESLLFPFLFLKSSVLRVLQENTRREI